MDKHDFPPTIYTEWAVGVTPASNHIPFGIDASGAARDATRGTTVVVVIDRIISACAACTSASPITASCRSVQRRRRRSPRSTQR